MKIGYIRVSTKEQNTARQEVLMEALGVDKIYIEKASGKNADRPQLQKMMGRLQPGDMVVVESISRFARNVADLLTLVDTLTEKGVEFVSKKESLDTSTPAGRLVLTVFGAIAEMERSYILDRQKEGIAIAKQNGVYKNCKGRARTLFDEKLFFELAEKIKRREINQSEAALALGVTQATVSRRMRELS